MDNEIFDQSPENEHMEEIVIDDYETLTDTTYIATLNGTIAVKHELTLGDIIIFVALFLVLVLQLIRTVTGR